MSNDPNVKTRNKLKIISILLLVVGIPLAIAGAIAFGYLSANFSPCHLKRVLNLAQWLLEW